MEFGLGAAPQQEVEQHKVLLGYLRMHTRQVDVVGFLRSCGATDPCYVHLICNVHSRRA